MDDRDRKIMKLLMQNGREKISDIYRELGIPRITVYERIKGMVDNGIIKKFTLVPDYDSIGLSAVAFIFVSFRNTGKLSQRELAQLISEFPEVHETFIVAGQWDILIKVRAKSTIEIGNFVLDKLRVIDGVENTETISIFSAVKD